MNVPRCWSLQLYTMLTVALFIAVALLPAGFGLGSSLWVDGRLDVSAYRAVLAEGRQWGLLRNTAAIAAGTTLCAAILGVSAGLALTCVGTWARKALGCGFAVSFLTPPYIAAIAWIDLLGNNGTVARTAKLWFGDGVRLPGIYNIPGVVFVLTLSYYPIVACATFLAFRRFDRRLEEAALLAAGKLRTFRSITFPLLAPAILTSALCVFMLTLVGFSVPSLLQVNAYAAEIYTQFSAFHDFPAAAAQAAPFVLCGGAALALWASYVRPKRAWLTGVRRPQPPLSPRWPARAAATVFAGGIVLVSAVLPVAVLVGRAMPLRSFIEALRTAKEEIATTALLGAATASIAACLAFSMAYLARVRPRIGVLFSLSLAPFLISGPVLGMGLIRLWDRPGPMALVYDGIGVVLLACAGRFLFFAHQGVVAALGELHPNLEEAAAVTGLAWWRQMGGITLPLLWPSLVAVWGLIFVLSAGELEATVLVCPPGVTPLSVRLFTLMHYGPSRLVAALSIITVVLILAGATLTLWAYGQARKAVHVGR